MNKIELSLKIYGEPILRNKARQVEKFDLSLSELFDELVRLMRKYQGIGFAATQAGLDLRAFVVDVGQGVYKMANPRIVRKNGFQSREEGCLSLPEIVVKVKRANDIVVEYQNEKEENLQLNCSGLFSCTIQHELDHLNGKLIIDYLPWAKRIFLKDRLRRLKDLKK